MKVIITESQYNRAVDSYISYLLEPHEVRIKNYPKSIFWVKNGNVIAEIEKSKTFWLPYDIWESISGMFNLDFDETQSVIKEWLEKHYNLGGLKPDPTARSYFNWLEEHHDFR